MGIDNSKTKARPTLLFVFLHVCLSVPSLQKSNEHVTLLTGNGAASMLIGFWHGALRPEKDGVLVDPTTRKTQIYIYDFSSN